MLATKRPFASRDNLTPDAQITLGSDSRFDAGGELRGHVWRVLDGLDTVVVDTAESAKIQADRDADLNGIDFHDPWRAVT
jgi:hypothetical protein